MLRKWWSPRNLLDAPLTRTAHIEFTSRCNLRCVFCCASQPYYIGQDLPVSLIEDLISTLIERRVELVCVSGHGETTIFPDWVRLCEKMLASGLNLHIISNFAKPLSDAEAEVLSRFLTIEVSCDTGDDQLFAKLRRNGRLSTLIANLDKVRLAGQKRAGSLPRISFSCVVSDQNVFKLDEFLDFALAHGIRQFDFCNLTKNPDVPDALNPRHVSELPEAESRSALAALERLVARMEEAKCSFYMQSGLLESLRCKVREAAARSHAKPTAAPGAESAGVIMIRREEPRSLAPTQQRKYASCVSFHGQTRDCLDPWTFFLLKANREVRPCCWHRPIFHLSDGQGMNRALDSFMIQKLRQSLLRGALDPDCRVCPSRGLIPSAQLRSKVKRFLYPHSPFCCATDEMPDFRILEFERTSGWFAEESGVLADGETANWCWTGPKAEISFLPSEKELRLCMHVEINEACFHGQMISVRLNGKVMDFFAPPGLFFYKEYDLPRHELRHGEKTVLSLEVGKTFSPAKLDPTSADARELGLRVFSLEFLAAAD